MNVATLDELDRLHRNSTLDVRHRELFTRKMQLAWPWISDRLRALITGAGTLHPPPARAAD